MTGIIDYGVGNLFSLAGSLKAIGADVRFIKEAKELDTCDRVILPGVGAFRDAAEKLRDTGLDEAVVNTAEKGVPLLGICLGMQLLFDKSYEFGEFRGLSLIKGEVVSMEGRVPPGLKIPQIGWNSLRFPREREKSRLYKYTEEGTNVYFVHSFFAVDCDESVSAFTDYGIDITASAESGNVFGMQFHPEKSGNAGLMMLRAFLEV